MLLSIAPLYCLCPTFKWSSMQSAEKCVAVRRALSHRLRRRKLTFNLNRLYVAQVRQFTNGLNLSALNRAGPSKHTEYKSAPKKSIFVQGMPNAMREVQIIVFFLLIHATKRLRLSDDESHDEEDDNEIYEFE